MILSLDYLYWVAGGLLLLIAAMILRDRTHPRRWTTALFWGLLAMSFLAGDHVPPAWIGAGVLLMAILVGGGWVTGGHHQERPEAEVRASAARLGNWLFLPTLAIPLITLLASVLLKDVHLAGVPLIDPRNVTFVCLGLGALVALILTCGMTRDTPLQGVREARRLVDTLGWALVLPQLLAMLGLVFTDAGVGRAVAHLATAYIDLDLRLVAVLVYVLGMAAFTVVMGNGFAAFPVMTGGIGIPVLVGVYHADPALVAAIGMFSGYCGTLMTPMAANFNVIPAALLGLADKNAVIKVQTPTALGILACNVVLLYGLM